MTSDPTQTPTPPAAPPPAVLQCLICVSRPDSSPCRCDTKGAAITVFQGNALCRCHLEEQLKW